MSAYVVDEDIIATLVSAGMQTGLLGPDVNLEQFGQMLWEENVASVNYRYSENDPAPQYSHPTVPLGDLRRTDVAKAVDTYSYQSNEHPEWDNSQAHAYCVFLMSTILTSAEKN
jgi:hypothetical protein